MTDFKSTFELIDQTKDKYKISNLLTPLSKIEPDENYIEHLKGLTTKVFEVKTSAINLLAGYNNSGLEDFFIERIEAEKNTLVSTRLIRGLELNGRAKSALFLLDFFKKTRRIDIKAEIVRTLRKIYLRNSLPEETIIQIKKLIGNNYPFFHGYFSGLKKAKKTTKKDWKELALSQLTNNKLNILYNDDNNHDIHISIELMKKDFIRSISVVVIPKKVKSEFSKYYTQPEMFESQSYLFTDIFEKTKEMRPDQKVEEILSLIELDMLPKIFERRKKIQQLGEMSFDLYLTNESELLKDTYGTDMEFAIANILTFDIHIFDNNPERSKFIDLVKAKRVKVDGQNFAIDDYLDMKKAGNNTYDLNL